MAALAGLAPKLFARVAAKAAAPPTVAQPITLQRDNRSVPRRTDFV